MGGIAPIVSGPTAGWIYGAFGGTALFAHLRRAAARGVRHGVAGPRAPRRRPARAGRRRVRGRGRRASPEPPRDRSGRVRGRRRRDHRPMSRAPPSGPAGCWPSRCSPGVLVGPSTPVAVSAQESGPPAAVPAHHPGPERAPPVHRAQASPSRTTRPSTPSSRPTPRIRDGSRSPTTGTRPTPDECGSPALGSGLRVSRDRGRTWREAKGQPWAGSGRVPNWHATIAWGPGPRPGRARLYWADTTLSGCSFSDHRLSIAWSDDEGDTWSPLFVLRDVPATGEGGYPDITVDRDPDSPNHGVVYAAINWFPSASAEPGFRLLASPDHGATWDGVEVPPVPAPAGYPFAYRIGERLRAAPDGAAVRRVAPGGHHGRRPGHDRPRGVRRDAHRVSPRRRPLPVREPLPLRAMSVNGVSIGTQPAPGTTDTLRLRPRWTIGLDVDPATGRVLVALPDYDVTPPGRSGAGRGAGGPLRRRRTHLARGRRSRRCRRWADGRSRRTSRRSRSPATSSWSASTASWTCRSGRRRGAASRRSVRRSSCPATAARRSRHPSPCSAGAWDLEDLARLGNRAGLRDRMEATADGVLVWAFADGRQGGRGGRARARIMVTRIVRVPPALVAGPVCGPQDGRARRLPS